MQRRKLNLPSHPSPALAYRMYRSVGALRFRLLENTKSNAMPGLNEENQTHTDVAGGEWRSVREFLTMTSVSIVSILGVQSFHRYCLCSDRVWHAVRNCGCFFAVVFEIAQPLSTHKNHIGFPPVNKCAGSLRRGIPIGQDETSLLIGSEDHLRPRDHIAS